jgi:hypothetical protein
VLIHHPSALDSAKNLSHNTENLAFNTLTSCSGRSFAGVLLSISAWFFSSSSAIESSMTSALLRLDLIACLAFVGVEYSPGASFDLSADWLGVYDVSAFL